MLKSILFSLVISVSWFSTAAQQDNIYLRQANIEIDNAQTSFLGIVGNNEDGPGY